MQKKQAVSVSEKAAHDLHKPIGLILTYSGFLIDENAHVLTPEQPIHFPVPSGFLDRLPCRGLKFSG